MRPALVLVSLLLCPVALLADDYVVQADSRVDFSAIRSFMFRDRRIRSDRPELNNSLVLTRITDTIRASLVARGLKEVADNPDVMVEFDAAGQDYSVGPFGRASRIGEPGGRRGRGESSQPLAFVEGVLVLDLIARESGLLVWRGVYRDSEKDHGKFAQKLPGDAGKLLADFPPRGR